MNIVITGGSGYVGTQLALHLLKRGHAVRVIDMKDLHPSVATKVGFRQFNLIEDEIKPEWFSDQDIWVHLAGVPVFKRWNEAYKRLIYNSRVVTAERVATVLQNNNIGLQAVVTASATGIYGNRAGEQLNESSIPDEGFLAQVCTDWEKATQVLTGYNAKRHVAVRTSAVLGQVGYFPTQKRLTQWGLGGRMGDGKHWFPWIHIDDLVSIYTMAIEREQVSGVINAVAPESHTQNEIAVAFRKQFKSPFGIPTPKQAIRMMYGEFSTIVEHSQLVISEVLPQHGYRFKYATLEAALQQLSAKN